jgi:hypothetical protein
MRSRSHRCRTQEVKANDQAIEGHDDGYVAALFLNIPAKNCGILQKDNDIHLLPGGQYCITDPKVTLRSLYTCGETQLEMPTKDM